MCGRGCLGIVARFAPWVRFGLGLEDKLGKLRIFDDWLCSSESFAMWFNLGNTFGEASRIFLFEINNLENYEKYSG
jgi:hypothetical protein